MDHSQIVRRAASIVWSYKALWVFGFFVALASGGSSGSGGGGGDSSGGGGSGPELPPDIQNFIDSFDPAAVLPTLIAIGVAILLFFIILGIALTILNYVSQVALIKMVNTYEASGEKSTIREGFRLGWSRNAFQLWLIDLLIALPIILLVGIPIVALVAIGFALGEAAIPLFILGFCGLILFVFVFSIIVTLLRHFVQREVILGEYRIFASIQSGYSLVRGNLGAIALMWLIMVGIGIAWLMVTFITTIVILIATGLVGVAAFAIGAGIASVFTSGTFIWIVGGVFALIVFLPLLIVLTSVVGGVFQVFVSSVWTLAYRELTAMTGGEPVLGEPSPDSTPPALDGPSEPVPAV